MKYYGQNFVIDVRIVKKIIDASNLKSFEDVCEMGAGKGILTEQLCKNARFVRSFEVDRVLYHKIKDLQSKFKNLEIINSNMLEYNKPLEFDVFVSNIPYSKSKEVFLWLATKKFVRAIIMVQDEFSKKLQSKIGDKNYRAISAIAQYCYDIEPVFKVDRKAFYPRPTVDSQILKLTSKNRLLSRKIISNIELIFSFKNKNIHKLNKKFNTKFNPIDRKIREIAPEKIIAFSKLM